MPTAANATEPLEALGRLSPGQRAAVVLHDHVGNSTREVAAILGSTAPDLRERIRNREPRVPRTEPSLRRAAIALLALVVAAEAIGFAVRAFRGAESGVRPATTMGNGLIAFSRGGAEPGLYAMNPDGTGVTSLTSEAVDSDPAWSPDGTRIAFVGGFSGGREGIYLMDADGTGVQRITDGGSGIDGSDASPDWSPDGSRIAFAREGRPAGADTGNADIYVVEANGTGLVRLTDDPVMEYEPAWSPDGSTIAFVGYDLASGGPPPSAVRLYVMNADGTGISELGPENVEGPAWSPDGSEIAYVDIETGAIMTIRPNGTGQRTILDAAGLVGGVHLVYGATWSPDGTKLVFMAGPDAGDTHIDVVDRDGSGFTQLTDDPASDAWPTWQPVPAPEASATPTPSPSENLGNGLIAFGCGYHLCTVMPDGSGFTDLIEPYDRDVVLAAYSPVFSPDGSKIVFRGYPRSGLGASGGANYDLYVMNTDGSGVTNVTRSPDDVRRGVSQYYAEWSPDGSMIAYDSDDGGFHVMNADGSDERKIVDEGGSPTWSPDGSWIAFVMGRDHGAELWKIHPDGTGLTQLTQSTGSDELPVWSPDGSRIAFLRDRVLYLVNADGTGLTVLADIQGAYPFQPQWSPDGTTLVFEVEMPSETPSEQAGRNYDIFEVNADGTGLIDLTPTANVAENYPIWSPDGGEIAFGASDVLTGDNTGSYDLYTMNPDGTGVNRLTTDGGLGAEFDISWQRMFG